MYFFVIRIIHGQTLYKSFHNLFLFFEDSMVGIFATIVELFVILAIL